MAWDCLGEHCPNCVRNMYFYQDKWHCPDCEFKAAAVNTIEGIEK